MILREKVLKAREALNFKMEAEFRALMEEIQGNLRSIGEPNRENPPVALCCFSFEGGVIYCGDKMPLGTPEQSGKTCLLCFDSCKKEYERLRKIMEEE